MHTLSGAYALDALSDVERAAFARHLEQCEPCAQEVAELRATAARLGAAMAEEPPPDLKPRVMAAMHATRQVPPRTRSAQHERHRPPSRAPRWAVGVATAAAAIGLAVGAVSGYLALSTQDRLNAAQQQLDQTRNRFAPVAAVLAAPDAKTAHGDSAIGGGATVVSSRSLNRVVLVDTGLPAQAAGQVYEAWLITGTAAPRPAGLFGGDGSPVVVDGVGDADHVALSVEQAGGSPTGSPSKNIVLKMAMPA
jgi:anti-sigma-K factor RskA